MSALTTAVIWFIVGTVVGVFLPAAVLGLRDLLRHRPKRTIIRPKLPHYRAPSSEPLHPNILRPRSGRHVMGGPDL